MTTAKAHLIEDQVRDILVEVLIVDETDITPGARLYEDLNADSLDVVEVGLKIEEKFGFEVDDEDGDKMKTVDDVVNMVKRKLKK